jgi:hypothetical protein
VTLKISDDIQDHLAQVTDAEGNVTTYTTSAAISGRARSPPSPAPRPPPTTPILETSSAGVSLWGGGFEPFGKDWNRAQTAGELLRFPGQWEDAAWTGVGSGMFYNVNRW